MTNTREEMEKDHQIDTQKDQYLIFSLGSEFYGIDIKNVTEITGIQKITPVPELQNYVKGIINLRGKIIPVIDVRIRFGMEEVPYNDRTCVVIAEVAEHSVGLLVDSVSEVLSLKDSEIVSPPEFGQDTNKFISGIGKSGNEVKLLIDCEKLIKEEEVVKIEQTIG